MNYKDPENVEEILERLKTLPTLKEVKELIDQVFPTWIVTAIPGYSNDYKFFQNNWIMISGMGHVPTTEILIVGDMVFDEDHILIRTFAELLTRSGFSVRRKQEFIPCETCGLAIPTLNFYNLIEERSVIPPKWSSKCTSC